MHDSNICTCETLENPGTVTLLFLAKLHGFTLGVEKNQLELRASLHESAYLCIRIVLSYQVQ
jgi:hypothetical protein